MNNIFGICFVFLLICFSRCQQYDELKLLTSGNVESESHNKSTCAICPGLEPLIQTLPMVRLHHKGSYDIRDDDSADFLGEMQFACFTGSFFSNLTRKEATLYNVTVDTRFGPYGQCNRGYCNFPSCVNHTFPTVPFVGRAGANQVLYGQCDQKNEYGTWYSLLEKFQCDDSSGQTIGVDCAWRLDGIVKSIDYSCLEQHGIDEACKSVNGTHGPYTEARDILVTGFQKDEFEEGGCPNVHY